MKIFTCLLAIAIGFMSASAAQLSEDPKSHSLPITNPQEISITCPKEITYQIQPIAEWDALLYGFKKLPFLDAVVDGRALRCNYSVSNGVTRDYSTLTKETPAGYVCTVQKTVNKNRQFTCKRAVAPIKIKPKSD